MFSSVNYNVEQYGLYHCKGHKGDITLSIHTHMHAHNVASFMHFKAILSH